MKKNRKNTNAAHDELPITTRKNWKWLGTEKLTAHDVLGELRTRTVEFTDENNLDWAITVYHLPTDNGTLEIKVALTPEQDVEYSVEGMTTFNQKEATAWIESLRSAELVF